MEAIRKRVAELAEVEDIMSLTSPATDIGTRNAMAQITTDLSQLLPPERVGIIEIALTEIFNNIVEHAYADMPDGEIRLRAFLQDSILRFEICDDGMPLPGLELPAGREQDLSVSRENLPEGGFGWMLIRTAARDLHYDRNDGTSCLQVTFDLAETG